MHRARNLTLKCLGFVLGAILGFSACEVFRALPARRSFQDLYFAELHNSVITCEQIRKDRCDRLLKNTEKYILTETRAITNHFASHPGKEYILWKIAAYFRGSPNSLSVEDRRLVDSLPGVRPEPGRMFYSQPPPGLEEP